jgi:hypothetical protein
VINNGVYKSYTWVNAMIGNVKRLVNGAYHAINHKHLPRYLAGLAKKGQVTLLGNEGNLTPLSALSWLMGALFFL